MRESIRPLLPTAFATTWRLDNPGRLDDTLPEEFIEAYSTLCEALYFGLERHDVLESGAKLSGSRPDTIPLKDLRLLRTKATVDRHLAAIAAALLEARGGKKRSSVEGLADARGVYRPQARRAKATRRPVGGTLDAHSR